MLTIHRKAYVRSDGTRVRAATYKAKGRGAKGRTPESGRWYSPRVRTGWSKNLSQKVRIAKVVRAHKGDLLASARSMQALANVTTDKETKILAHRDARVLYQRHAKGG